jgi:hypothetical protein
MNYDTSHDSLEVRIPVGEIEAPDYWSPEELQLFYLASRLKYEITFFFKPIKIFHNTAPEVKNKSACLP